MSDSINRPTHTFDKNLYNATQVRLYGISPPTDQSSDRSFKIGNYTISIEAKDEKKQIQFDYFRLIDDGEKPVLILTHRIKDENDGRSIGIIYGYAYEGHCYDLPKPAIMVLPVPPKKDFPADDCGYDKKKDHHYKVWIVDKLSECQHIEVSSGFVEQLILDANMPGRRSPSTYRAHMQLAHRSGRMSE